ncbi:MAG: hypothetical protein QNJ22_17080 [Desulfosarcinaceae bacterium]|nr:hypothetical protein [Desulfosarcinaceae bacterium]
MNTLENRSERPSQPERRKRLTWRLRLTLLVILAIPAFSGYPLGHAASEIVAGATVGWTLYWLMTTGCLRLLNGARRHGIILAASVLITLPVVFVGAGVSFLLELGSGPLGRLAFAYSDHYIEICLTMLTVVPLALSLAATVPLQALEQRLLSGSLITARGKAMLMALRVFNHIVFFVIPTILEVVREERVGGRWASPRNRNGGLRDRWRRGRRLVDNLVLIATEGICSAVQFIPLWAVEIARLPSERTNRDRSTRDP